MSRSTDAVDVIRSRSALVIPFLRFGIQLTSSLLLHCFPHGRIVVLSGHPFGVEVIGFSTDQALTRPAPSTDHAQLGMMSVTAPAENSKSAVTGWVTIRYKNR